MIKLNVSIDKQPDYTTCGPTSLHAVYRYYGDLIALDEVINEINQFEEGGGTLAAVLGKHALERGYEVSIVSYNINIFDPTWFNLSSEQICKKLEESLKSPNINSKHKFALNQYIAFIKSGGQLIFEDLSGKLLKKIIKKRIPILTGLSSTWLYRDKRENPVTNEYDDLNGEPVGHFVVIDGYSRKEFFICDPYHNNPINSSHHYNIEATRLLSSVLLGISSYDGNLLLIKKKDE